jgi:hypothetical protein
LRIVVVPSLLLKKKTSWVAPAFERLESINQI